MRLRLLKYILSLNRFQYSNKKYFFNSYITLYYRYTRLDCVVGVTPIWCRSVGWHMLDTAWFFLYYLALVCKTPRSVVPEEENGNDAGHLVLRHSVVIHIYLKIFLPTSKKERRSLICMYIYIPSKREIVGNSPILIEMDSKRFFISIRIN